MTGGHRKRKRSIWSSWVLGVALFACQTSREVDVETDMLFDVSRFDFDGLQYDWPDGRIELSHRKTVSGSEYPIVHQKREFKQSVSPLASAKDDLTTKQRDALREFNLSRHTTFPAGTATIRALEALLPLRLAKHLGNPDAERLVEMGLSRPLRRLTLRGASQVIELELGSENHSDHGRYARKPGSRDVYILPAKAWRGLEGSALRLMDAKIVQSALSDLASFTVDYDGYVHSWTVHQRGQPAQPYFSSTRQAEASAPNAEALVAILNRLRVRSYISEPDKARLVQIASFTFRRVDGAAEKLVLYRERSAKRGVVSCRGWWADINDGMVDKIEVALPNPLE